MICRLISQFLLLKTHLLVIPGTTTWWRSSAVGGLQMETTTTWEEWTSNALWIQLTTCLWLLHTYQESAQQVPGALLCFQAWSFHMVLCLFSNDFLCLNRRQPCFWSSMPFISTLRRPSNKILMKVILSRSHWVKLSSSASAGIGDGGNELGMGKVKDIVKAKMPKGEMIACDVAADFAVTAGENNTTIQVVIQVISLCKGNLLRCCSEFLVLNLQPFLCWRLLSRSSVLYFILVKV